MIASLDRRLDLKILLWAFPVVFLIHDLEEILTMEQFARQLLGQRLGWAPAGLAPTTAQFSVSVAFLLAICALAAWGAASAPRPDARLRFFCICLAVLFLNVLTHVGQTILLGRYTPGVITAVLVSLPYTLYGFHRLFQARLLNRNSLARDLLVGAIVSIPVVVIALAVGKVLIPAA